MEACAKWWVRRCLKCQARKTSRQAVRWLVLPISLPNSPGVAVGVDYFGPLPITARGNSYILLFAFTDRFSRRVDMFAVTTAEFTAEGTANILVDRFIPLWGCPSTLLSDNGPQFCARLATAVYKLLGIHKLTTSTYHPSGNGGVERVNHTMAQMLAMVCNEHQNDWDYHLPHVEYAYNNSVSAATGLAPNEVHIGRLPRLPSPSLIDRTVAPRPSEPRPRPTHLLRPRSRASTTRLRTCARTARPHRCSSKRAQFRCLRCPPPPPQIHGWRMGMGLR